MMTLKITLKGGKGSGWFSPPRGTHTGERHKKVGSGRTGGVVSGKSSISVGSVANAAAKLRKAFGVGKESFGSDHSVRLKEKYTLPEIYAKLEDLGLTKMDKPSYAQSFDAAWYTDGKGRVVRVQGRGLIRGAEKWKALLVIDL